MSPIGVFCAFCIAVYIIIKTLIFIFNGGRTSREVRAEKLDSLLNSASTMNDFVKKFGDVESIYYGQSTMDCHWGKYPDKWRFAVVFDYEGRLIGIKYRSEI